MHVVMINVAEKMKFDDLFYLPGISLRLKAFNLFNKHMHGVYIAWLLS